MKHLLENLGNLKAGIDELNERATAELEHWERLVKLTEKWNAEDEGRDNDRERTSDVGDL